MEYMMSKISSALKCFCVFLNVYVLENELFYVQSLEFILFPSQQLLKSLTSQQLNFSLGEDMLIYLG